MKKHHTVWISALLLGSSAAMAAGGGGAASDSAVTAADSGSSAPKAHAMKKSTHKAPMKAANDTTNMPGADASSDTKGH